MTEIRKATEADFDEMFRRNPSTWKDAIKRHGGRNRLIDEWVVWAVSRALREIFKGRWNFDEDARVALINARSAVERLELAMRKARR